MLLTPKPKKPMSSTSRNKAPQSKGKPKEKDQLPLSIT